CYYNAALQAMDEENVRGNEDVNQLVGAGVSSGIATIATFMTAKYLIDRKKSGDTCKATSLWMMLGAGAAVVVGEVVANVTYRNKLKKEIENYEKEVQPASSSEDLTDQELVENSTDNQLQAFQFLINQEGHRKNMMKTRKNIYTGVTALYGGAVVVSVLE